MSATKGNPAVASNIEEKALESVEPAAQTDSQPSQPPRSSPVAPDDLPEDLSQLGLNLDDEEQLSDSLNYQRGGRKKRKGHMPPPGDTQLPWSERSGRLESFAEPTISREEEQSPIAPSQHEPEAAADTPCPHCARPMPKSRQSADPLQKEQGESSKARLKPSGAGLFNLKRGNKPGPPIGVYVDRPDEPKSKKSKKKKKSKRKSKKSKSAQGEESSSSSSSGSSDEEEEEEKPRKPVQIRLDLNLDLEILFKAKIKGDVTITFLE
ncbi:hypothetical protein B0O99DRAFT_695175 [Bisporella sp. PMI_857]|nr:hypothetical protein B0O99DRAFT_695175 [Bisporella sp. PMI_857]